LTGGGRPAGRPRGRAPHGSSGRPATATAAAHPPPPGSRSREPVLDRPRL